MTETTEPISPARAKRAPRRTAAKSEPTAQLDQLVDLTAAVAQHEEKVAARRSSRTATATPETAPKARSTARSRRATSPPADADATVPPAAVGTADPPAAVGDGEAPPARPRRSRAKAPAAASPSPSQSFDKPLAASADASPAPLADPHLIADPSPTKPVRPRRRATAPASTPATQPAALAAPAVPAPAADGASTAVAGPSAPSESATPPESAPPASGRAAAPKARRATRATAAASGGPEPAAPSTRRRRAAAAPASPVASDGDPGVTGAHSGSVPDPSDVALDVDLPGARAEQPPAERDAEARPAPATKTTTRKARSAKTSRAVAATTDVAGKANEVSTPSSRSARAAEAVAALAELSSAVGDAVPAATGTDVAAPADPKPAKRARARAARPAALPDQATVSGGGPDASPEPAAAPAAIPDAVVPPGITPAGPFSQQPRLSQPSALPPTQRPAAPVAADGAPRLPMTALLFQAPELVTPPPAHRPEAPVPSDNADEVGADLGPAEGADAGPRTGTKKTPATGKKKGKNKAKDAAGVSSAKTPDASPASDAPPQEPSAQSGGEQPADASQADGGEEGPGKPRRRGGRGKGGKGRGRSEETTVEAEAGPSSSAGDDDPDSGTSHRRRRRRRGERTSESVADEVTGLTSSTRLEAKRQRRREGRDAGRRRPVITESEFLARRESVDRVMAVRELEGRTQIAVLEDGILVEHYLSRHAQSTLVGDVYLGRVHNVLPSMEAAFVDIGKTRNAVLYAGEVNWDAAGMSGQPRRIEDALKSGDAVLVQVTKDPIGHKGARLTSQITLAGRHMVLVPGGGMTGISRKLPDSERSRLKKLLKKIVPQGAGVIVRTAAEGASEADLTADMARLTDRWAQIQAKSTKAHAPALLKGEPDVAIRVIRDVFNEDFTSLVVQGSGAWKQISSYIGEVAPDLASRMEPWDGPGDVFARHRIDEQLLKALDRKVWLPSGGSLVIDRTEAMTVVDVNTGKFTGSGGTLEETVTRNNLEAAEEIVRQLRLRDIGGI
ncbi:MAG: Rne/Rng family ribonuclease, partial [Bifidobacteriaceae bacterium]|nr:Rne/Rng family ribonuclease [Bifidobacteriaceae bacterium]